MALEQPVYAPGDLVRVKAIYPPGHIRTPFFIRGQKGQIVSILGSFGNPETLAYGGSGRPAQPLYRVAFAQTEVWDGYQGPADDRLIVDIYEHWLEAGDAPA